MNDHSSVPRSSFSVAMRILPKDQRDAIFSVYRFCRSVDDIADEPQYSTRTQRIDQLRLWREEIEKIYSGRPAPWVADLDAAVRRYGLKRSDFEAVIDGVTMDAERDMRAPDWATLDLYCDRVASAVGRLCEHKDRVLFVKYPGLDASGVLGNSVSEQISWIKARFSGLPAPSNCR